VLAVQADVDRERDGLTTPGWLDSGGFDQLHKVSGSAWLRRDSDKNNGPRARLSEPRCCK